MSLEALTDSEHSVLVGLQSDAVRIARQGGGSDLLRSLSEYANEYPDRFPALAARLTATLDKLLPVAEQGDSREGAVIAMSDRRGGRP